MSIRQVSAIFERKCDNCGQILVWDGMAPTEEQQEALDAYYAIAKEFTVGGQTRPVVLHACSQVCAAAIIEGDKIQPPPESKPTIYRGKMPQPHETGNY